MKTNRSKRFAGLVFALAVATATAYAGNNQCRKNFNRGTCIYQVSSLSAEQNSKFSSLQSEHLKTMDRLRDSRRGTADLTQKDRIRNEMITENQNYRNEIKSLLTPELQNQLMSSVQMKGKGQGNCNNKSAGKMKGKRSGNQPGKGNAICRQS